MERFRDGSQLELQAGYSRGVRIGPMIAISGTTANDSDGNAAHIGDTGAQTRMSLNHAIAAVLSLGGSKESIVRTRILLTPDADWRAASQAHEQLLGEMAPANSMYRVHSLIGDGFLVEVEIDAVVEPAPGLADADRGAGRQ